MAALASEMGAGGFLSRQEAGPGLSGSFDFVVGTPPYRKLGQMDPVLRSAFGSSIYGHANAYGVFLHAGIEMLRLNGRLGFIVPRSMLSGLYFQTCGDSSRREPVSRSFRCWSNARHLSSGPSGNDDRRAPASRVGRGRAQSIRTGVVRSVTSSPTGASPRPGGHRQVARRLNGTTVWFVSDREQTYSLIDKIIDDHPLLGVRASRARRRRDRLSGIGSKPTCVPGWPRDAAVGSGRPT